MAYEHKMHLRVMTMQLTRRLEKPRMIFLRIKPADQPDQGRLLRNTQLSPYLESGIVVRFESGQIETIGHDHHFFCRITTRHMNLPCLLGTREDS